MSRTSDEVVHNHVLSLLESLERQDVTAAQLWQTFASQNIINLKPEATVDVLPLKVMREQAAAEGLAVATELESSRLSGAALASYPALHRLLQLKIRIKEAAEMRDRLLSINSAQCQTADELIQTAKQTAFNMMSKSVTRVSSPYKSSAVIALRRVKEAVERSLLAESEQLAGAAEAVCLYSGVTLHILQITAEYLHATTAAIEDPGFVYDPDVHDLRKRTFAFAPSHSTPATLSVVNLRKTLTALTRQHENTLDTLASYKQLTQDVQAEVEKGWNGGRATGEEQSPAAEHSGSEEGEGDALHLADSDKAAPDSLQHSNTRVSDAGSPAGSSRHAHHDASPRAKSTSQTDAVQLMESLLDKLQHLRLPKSPAASVARSTPSHYDKTVVSHDGLRRSSNVSSGSKTNASAASRAAQSVRSGHSPQFARPLVANVAVLDGVPIETYQPPVSHTLKLVDRTAPRRHLPPSPSIAGSGGLKPATVRMDRAGRPRTLSPRSALGARATQASQRQERALHSFYNYAQAGLSEEWRAARRAVHAVAEDVPEVIPGRGEQLFAQLFEQSLEDAELSQPDQPQNDDAATVILESPAPSLERSRGVESTRSAAVMPSPEPVRGRSQHTAVSKAQSSWESVLAPENPEAGGRASSVPSQQRRRRSRAGYVLLTSAGEGKYRSGSADARGRGSERASQPAQRLSPRAERQPATVTAVDRGTGAFSHHVSRHTLAELAALQTKSRPVEQQAPDADTMRILQRIVRSAVDANNSLGNSNAELSAAIESAALHLGTIVSHGK